MASTMIPHAPLAIYLMSVHVGIMPGDVCLSLEALDILWYVLVAIPVADASPYGCSAQQHMDNRGMGTIYTPLGIITYLWVSNIWPEGRVESR